LRFGLGAIGAIAALLRAKPPTPPRPHRHRPRAPYRSPSEPRFCAGIANLTYGAGQRRRLRQGQSLFVRPTHAQQKRAARNRNGEMLGSRG
jgi:hypothetical protein